MRNQRRGTLLACACAVLCLAASARAFEQVGYGYQERQGSSSNRFYLGFSIADGTYFNYKCDYNDCDAVIVAPLDFEILLGYKLTKHLYLDIGFNWAVDYIQKYYEEVTYLAGVRPGIRLTFPLLFHRHLYFRAAVPIQYTIDDDDSDEDEDVVLGILLGAGIEWRWDNLGFFLEADISPYFIEIYPGYYVIPVQGRAGVSVSF